MREKELIEQELRLWFSQMVDKYKWLTIKFEWSDARNCFLVCYYPKSVIDKSDEFCSEAISFEDRITEKYDDDAPLFCDEEELFSLSPNAEIIRDKSDIY